MYVSVTKITIVLCWLSLFSFWAIKLFGGNWFEIMVENENFVQFSNMVQNTWLKYVVSLFTVFFGNYFLFGAIQQQFKFDFRQFIVVIGITISMWIVANWIDFAQMKVWYGYVVIAIYGATVQVGWKRFFGVIAIVLQFIFSTISLLTRNVQFQLITNYLLIMVFLIDVYIMYILYYLYSNLIRLKKEI